MSLTRYAILLGIFTLFVGVSSWDFPGFASDFNKIIREVDVIKIEGSADRELKWKDYSKELKNKLDTFGKNINAQIKNMKDSAAKSYLGVKDSAKKLIKKRVESNIHREEEHLHEMKNIWTQLWKNFKRDVAKSLIRSKKEVHTPKQEIENFILSLEKDVQDKIGRQQWEQLGNQIRDEISQLQLHFFSRIEQN